MDVLNPVSLVLGIISSAISIYTFVQKRLGASVGAEAPAGPAHGSHARTPPFKQAHPSPQANAAPQAAAAPPPGRSGLRLGHVTGVWWGLVGFGCISEGATFGEPFLLMIGAGFFYLAYYCWRR